MNEPGPSRRLDVAHHGLHDARAPTLPLELGQDDHVLQVEVDPAVPDDATAADRVAVPFEHDRVQRARQARHDAVRVHLVPADARAQAPVLLGRRRSLDQRDRPAAAHGPGSVEMSGGPQALIRRSRSSHRPRRTIGARTQAHRDEGGRHGSEARNADRRDRARHHGRAQHGGRRGHLSEPAAAGRGSCRARPGGLRGSDRQPLPADGPGGPVDLPRDRSGGRAAARRRER